MFTWIPKNQVQLLTLSFILMTQYFKALEACLGVVKGTSLIELNHSIASLDLYPYAKHGL